MVPALAVAQGFSPAIAVAQGLSPAIAVAQDFSPAIAVAQDFSPAIAVAQGFSPAIAVAQGFSPAIAVAQGFSPAVAARATPSSLNLVPSRQAQHFAVTPYSRLHSVRLQKSIVERVARAAGGRNCVPANAIGNRTEVCARALVEPLRDVVAIGSRQRPDDRSI